MKDQTKLQKWTAGFFDGEGCVGGKIGENTKTDKPHYISPECRVNHTYHAGLFDAEGSISTNLKKEKTATIDHHASVRCRLTQLDMNTPIVDRLSDFGDSIGVDYTTNHSEMDGENHKAIFTFAVRGVDNVEAFLSALEPDLVVKQEQAQIMLNEILPRLRRGEHTNRRGFLRLMSHVDKMNNLKGGNRGKYTLAYFEDLWDMSLD